MNALAQRKHAAHDDVVLFQIANQMTKAGLSDDFVAATIRTAMEYEGVEDLVKMWANEDDKNEREEIIADIQEMIDACLQSTKTEYPFIKLNDLEAISEHIREFKDSLLHIVIERGGVNHLAELTGIPQPSLSRFFNSNAMPQRSTLLKISKALKLDAVQTEMAWAR